MIVIGKTGTGKKGVNSELYCNIMLLYNLGKSTLCNRIAGLAPNASLFPVSDSANSCTQGTKFGNVSFWGKSFHGRGKIIPFDTLLY